MPGIMAAMTESVPHVQLNDTTSMPQLGFGVWRVADADAEVAVGTALEAGYRSIDTATLYGNEGGVGRALAASCIPRDELYVTTKVWNDDQGFEATMAAFDASLERLGLDYLDLYLIHWPCPAQDRYVDTFRALVALQTQGRLRSVGVSNFLPEHLDRLIEETEVVPAVNQVELHPYLQQPALRAYHRRLSIATEAWAPLGAGQGLLDDPVLARVAAAHAVTPARVVLRWHLDQGNVVIPKSVTPSRIRDNIDVFGFTLTADDTAVIESLNREQRYGAHPNEVSS